jgi:hypothetical protein
MIPFQIAIQLGTIQLVCELVTTRSTAYCEDSKGISYQHNNQGTSCAVSLTQNLLVSRCMEWQVLHIDEAHNETYRWACIK